MPAVFVVRAAEKGEPVPGVSEELQAGRATIGWSYQDKLDLRLIQGKLDRGESLDSEEIGAKRCLGFLTRVEVGDYLLYPHQPDSRQFLVARVAGDYCYLNKEEGLGVNDGSDFRSFRPCSIETPEPVYWYDEIVRADLRQDLGRPPRFYEIGDTTSFFAFLEDVPEAGRQQDGTNRSSLRRIGIELRKVLPDALRREFSRADLARRFCRELFERMGYSPEVQEGPAEAGSDVVVTINDPLLPEGEEIRIGIQAFAYQGGRRGTFPSDQVGAVDSGLGGELPQLWCLAHNRTL